MVFISSLGENETVIRTFEVYLHSLSASAKIKKKKKRDFNLHFNLLFWIQQDIWVSKDDLPLFSCTF